MQAPIIKCINQIKEFVATLANFSNSPTDYSQFTALIRSSLIRNYEFLKLVFLDEQFDNYFFVISCLRSTIEDIIVLESVHNLSEEDREKLLRGIQSLEVQERILKQWDFFQMYRPFQPVINKGYSFDEAKNNVQSIWQQNGWPKFEVTSKRLMPSTIELAKKLAPGTLDILYEFIYRLSSSTVHFSPQALLRMSWGEIDNENNMSGTISVKHMANYYRAFCQIYGAMLFSFYFEFFPEEINATAKEQDTIIEIRKSILKELRWPEMITFEEMNLPIPNAYHDQILTYGIIHQAIMEMLKTGFVKNNYKQFLEVIKLPSQE